MKKLMTIMLAICLVATLGTTISFAQVAYSNGAAGHVTTGEDLTATLTGDFAYVNPFALITFGDIHKAILEGDGGLAGNVEGSLWATGYVPVNLYCNTALRMSATVVGGSFNWEYNTPVPNDNSNHPNGADNHPYRALPVDLGWNSDSLVLGTNVYQGSPQNADTTALSSKLYDAWTYQNEILNFKVHAPNDNNGTTFVPNSIDELHAGTYTGKVIVTVTAAQVDTSNKETPSIEEHNSAACSFGY